MGGGGMRAQPLGPSVELSMGPRVRGVREACGRWHWGLQWNSVWRRETHAGAATGAFGGDPYGAMKRVRGVPKLVWGTRAVATKRARGVPKLVWRTRACGGIGAFGGGNET
eukprot:8351111-Pyramimonas_sp.AAC.1